MRRAAYIAALLLLSSPAWADQGWPQNQKGNGHLFYDVGSGQLNNGIGSGNRCVEFDPTGKLVPTGASCSSTPVLNVSCAAPDARPAFDAAVAACPSTGCLIQLPLGVCTFKSASNVTKSGVHVQGYGAFTTTILVDDSGGAVGDAITFTGTYDDSIEGVSFDAPSRRTAGSYVTVAGGNASVAVLPTFGITATFFHLDDVDMNNFFNGIEIKDSAAHNGAWGVYITRGFYSHPHSGGTGIWMNSLGETNTYPNGASYFVNDAYFLGDASPLANTTAIQISGTSDFTIENTETWGFANGVLINPPTGTAVFSGHIQDSFIDFSENECVKITEAGGGLVRWMDISHTWFAGSATKSGLRIDGGHDISISGASRFYANALNGVLAVGSVRVSVLGSQFSQDGAPDIQMTAGSDYCTVTGNAANSTGQIGIEIDAGVHHCVVTGNNASNGNGIVNNGADTIANMNTGSLIALGIPQNPDPNQQALYLTLSNPGFPTNAYSMSELPDGIVETTTTGGLSALSTLTLTATPPIYTTSTSINTPNLTGAKLWLNGDVGITQSGGFVSAWADQSGNGNNVTASGAAQPAYAPTSLNGHSGISQATAGQRLQNLSNNVFASGASRYVFALVWPAASAGTFTTGGTYIAFKTANPVWQGLFASLAGTYVYSDGTTADLLTTPLVLSSPVLVEMGSTVGSPPVVFVNGVSKAVTASTNVNSDTGTTGFTVGGVFTAAGQFFAGNQYEYLAVDHTPTALELAQDRGYFQNKYNISIAGAGGNVIDFEGQGLYVSGSTSTTPQNLGSTLTTGLVCDTTSGGIATLSTCTAGTDYVHSMSFTDPAENLSTAATPDVAVKFDNASITLNGGGALQRAAVTGDCAITAGANSCTIATKGKIYVDATDAAAHSPDYLYPKLTSFTNTVSFSPIGTGDGQLTIDVVPSVYQQTKHDYAFQFTAAASVTNCGLFAGGNGIGAGCTLVEYPNNFQAGHIQLTANFGPTNTITVGTLSFQATLNGSPISGTQFSFTSVTSPGEAVISPQVTGSGAASDTYGLVFSTSGTYVGGFQTVTFQVTLSP